MPLAEPNMGENCTIKDGNGLHQQCHDQGGKVQSSDRTQHFLQRADHGLVARTTDWEIGL